MAEVIVEILEGTDVEVQITITDSLGVPLNLTALLGYVAYIYTSTEKFIARFSKNTKAGFDSTVAVDEPNGVFNVQLESSVTGKNLGRIFAEFKSQETNNAYENNTFDRAVMIDLKAEIVKALSEKDTDLT